MLSVIDVLEIGLGLEGFVLPVLLSGAAERSTERKKKQKKKKKKIMEDQKKKWKEMR